MITEAPEDDVRRSAMVDDHLHAVLSHLYHRTMPLPIVHLPSGHDCPVLYPYMINSKGIFQDTMIVFKQHDDGNHGTFSRLTQPFRDHDGNTIRYMVQIQLPPHNEMTPRAIYGDLSMSRIRDTFRHEFQHMLDHKRRKAPRRSEETVPQEDRDTAYMQKYFNSPQELNAFFHNVAEPLLDRVRFFQKHGLAPMGLFDPIDKSFDKFLKDRINQLYGPQRQFWNHLTPNNKKKVMTRLAKLHELFQKIISTEDKYDDTVEEPNV